MSTNEATTTESAPTKRKASKKASKETATKTAKAGSKKSAKAKAGKPQKTAKSATKERANTKKATVLEMLRRKEGATIAEIAKATNWQNHSIRGFISGTVTKKMGLEVDSAKNEGGERTYRIG